MCDVQTGCYNIKIFCIIAYHGLNSSHNYFDDPTESSFSNPYLAKFLNTSAKSFFPCKFDITLYSSFISVICYEVRDMTEVQDVLRHGCHVNVVATQALFSLYSNLGNLGRRRKFAVQVVSSRGSTTLRCIKSPREKLWSPRGVSRRNTKRPRDPSFPAQCTGARRLSARLHFETPLKLGNCIKSDLYLSVPGILAPREMQRHKFRATQRALSSITDLQRAYPRYHGKLV